MTVWAVGLTVLIFAVTIFVHELGHFLVARWCGMTVDTFSIGFGPALWKRTINGVVYKIGLLPLGGYVALPQMDPTGVTLVNADGTPRKLSPIGPGKKILVGLAGVTFNIILAFILAWVVFWHGRDFAPEFTQATVGYVLEDSAAWQAGLRSGHVIEAVNNEPVGDWQRSIVISALYDEVTLRLRTPDGTIYEALLATDRTHGVRMIPGIFPMSYCSVLRVMPGSAAEAAGIRSGDRIVELDGIELFSRGQMVELVQRLRDQQVDLVYLRSGERFSTQLTPRYDPDRDRVLIGIEFYTEEILRPMDQIKSHATLIFRILRALVTPKEAKAAAEGIGGPVLIIDMLFKIAGVGLIAALGFACLLNVNLAVLNLLPIPVLDGGHIVLSTVELITRRPVHPRIVTLLWNVGTILLLTLFVVLTFKDIRFISRNNNSSAPVPVEAPAEPADSVLPEAE
ncbi:MAG TPA: RIP metalloprotease RseP [Kiritimatiellia bacterium]|nr:RIP metalloprotease RseP [Kiritimatiellia bacterium]